MNATGPIVAAVDFSLGSTAVVAHAVATAEQANLPLLLIHVIDSKVLRHHPVVAGQAPDMDVLMSAARAHLSSMLSATGGYARVDVEVRHGRPSEEIHHVVENANASLLVLGSSDLTKKHIGSVTSNCLRTIPCDVLVLRDWQGIGFHRIVVCTDLIKTSGQALRRGVALARLYRAKLDVAYVMYPPSRNVWAELLEFKAEDPETFAERCKKSAEAELDEFVKKYGDQISSVQYRTSILESASPGLALKYHLGDTGADLVIVGSRLHFRIASLFSAGTAEQLLHYTTASVLAVRDHP